MDRPEDDSEIRSSLDEHGLFSPVIDDWRQNYLAEHQAWFDISRSINRTSTELYVAHWDKMGGQKMTALQPTAHRVFGRALNSFVGAVVLSERGSSIEAASLARSVSEASAWLGYMVERPDQALSDLEADDLHNFIGRYKELRRVSQQSNDVQTVNYALEEEQKLALALAGRKRPDWPQIAQTYGPASGYLKFRIMSGFYTHLSGASLQHYVQSTGDKGGMNILGPHADQIPNALYFACDAMTACGSAACVIFDDASLAIGFHDASQKVSSLRDAMAA